jgi:hypothetical protein
MMRGVLVWGLIMGLETIHGILRGLFLTPRVGEATASRIGWPIGAILVLTVTYLLFRWINIHDARGLLRLGLVWAVLTLIFESLIGSARGLTGAQIAADFNPLAGGLSLYTVLFMLAAPWLAAKLRGL